MPAARRVACASRPSDRFLVSRAPHGFPRTARLLTKADYRQAFSAGRKLSDRYFTLIVVCRGSGAGARLGLAVSRKHVRLAVGRSRLKRLIRESFRIHRPLLPDCDVVVLPRAAAAAASSPTLRASLERLWHALPAAA